MAISNDFMDGLLNPNNEPDVLPYANDQPANLHMGHSSWIERIPTLVTPAGQIIEPFQTFYNKLLCGIRTEDVAVLYNISDKVFTFEEFKKAYNNAIGSTLHELFVRPYSDYGWDLELNMSRFETCHRNIVGGFLLSTYGFESQKFEGITTDKNIVFRSGELLFSYKHKNFCLLSKFYPLAIV